MNIVSIPYHDWRKIEKEGARTRDAHLMHHLAKHSKVDNLLIVNRPITYTEMFLKKKKIKISGKLIFSHKNCKLYEIENNVYVLDYISMDFLGPIFKRKKWFFDSFRDHGLKEGFEKAIEFLQLEFDVIFSQNIFSSSFALNNNIDCVFDAWDNFLLFPENKTIEKELINSYQEFSDKAKGWITNSVKNISFYKSKYGLKECILIKNGVDIDVFNRKYPKPLDLEPIKQPVVGFGGKITHLFDYELFNYIVSQHKDKSFVIVGQILDKDVYSKIKIADNLFYLGDKNYTIYPSYVTNFDVGIIPYVTNHLEHGADSIKVYEYLASGIGVLGTQGAGMSDMNMFMSIAEDKEQFSALLDSVLMNNVKMELPNIYTWSYKTEEVLSVLEHNSKN